MMLYYYREYICTGILLILLFVFLQGVLAFLVNLQRKDGSPGRQAYHPFAMILAPFTWPLFMMRAFMSFAVRAALLVPLFLTFVLLLIFMRIPHSTGKKVETETMGPQRLGWGEQLLKLNTELLRWIFGIAAIPGKT